MFSRGIQSLSGVLRGLPLYGAEPHWAEWVFKRFSVGFSHFRAFYVGYRCTGRSRIGLNNSFLGDFRRFQGFLDKYYIYICGFSMSFPRKNSVLAGFSK